MYSTEECEGRLLYEVSWERPGFPANLAGFMVDKTKGVIIIKASAAGNWEFVDGKLKSETSIGSDPQRWDWARQRAKEIAEATYRVSNK